MRFDSVRLHNMFMSSSLQWDFITYAFDVLFLNAFFNAMLYLNDRLLPDLVCIM